MAKPSLKASSTGLQQAHEVFVKQELTQELIASKLGCNRSVVSKFFGGDNIWEKYFVEICKVLDLNWQEVTEGYITPLVETIRHKVKDSIQEWCGTIRILDMTQPIGLSQIYTDVNILEKPTALRRKTVGELLKEYGYKENFDRFALGKVIEERVLGEIAVEKYEKLIVLGKPGAGKTTFLKYLAIQCIQGKFKPNLVPIFISLKYFSETLEEYEFNLNKSSLIGYIEKQFSVCGVQENEILDLLKNGHALILMDGLDEVGAEYQKRTLQEVRDTFMMFHDNHFIITCRVAAWEDSFDAFTEVEISDFDDQQINNFANSWFKRKLVNSKDFIKQLKNNNRAYQLATTPLLLTLLCLVFEESGELPRNRSSLYQEGLSILLKKWDAKRGIYRDIGDIFYKKLSIDRKEKLLRMIAYDTFKEEKYFFTPQEIQTTIETNIKEIAHLDHDLIISQLDVEETLNSIEAQHGLIVERAKGIYSFSHLTFHEYFTAREITRSEKLQGLKELVNQLNNKRWREVFLLVSEMLDNSGDFFRMIKKSVDKISVEEKEILQTHLEKINEKVKPIQNLFEVTDNKDRLYASIRAFYFDIDYEIDPNRQLCLMLDQRSKYLICGSCFTRILNDIDSFEEGVIEAKKYDENHSGNNTKIIDASSSNEIMKIAVEYGINANRIKKDEQEKLEEIKNDFFDDLKIDEDRLKLGAERVRNIASNKQLGKALLGYDFQRFSDEEKKILKKYYDVNCLLVSCLNTDCTVDSQVFEEIFHGFLVPR
jgi:predicted NACHT family NTPase